MKIKLLDPDIVMGRLDSESVRYLKLAKDHAFAALNAPDAGSRQVFEQRARDHGIRAETYKAAAALVSAPSGVHHMGKT